MKNDMGLIMEGWRHTTLLEGVVKAIQDKSLEPEDVKKIGDKLSAKDPGFTLAVQFFNALSQTDPEEMDELGEGAMDWINSKIVQGMIAKDNLVDTLKSDPRFAPVLKLGGPALALAFLYFKHETGGIDPDDFGSAIDMIAKKGRVSLDNLADAALVESIRNQKEP